MRTICIKRNRFETVIETNFNTLYDVPGYLDWCEEHGEEPKELGVYDDGSTIYHVVDDAYDLSVGELYTVLAYVESTGGIGLSRDIISDIKYEADARGIFLI